ncbi:hypothetical protein TI39_contig370g00003 [Zymoseptoria brevis]|uniref:RRM domain-containing protein n=1 Tax=Zymoseptoria brevis TaxID=1047168 RepID=A0A0F4GP17_9PEZI|nr:hypothetical protein TI39_contig370g00003 [Zymoseptoria brevis]
MAELQTIAAVCDLIKVAYYAGVFLKRVKDADKIAVETGDRLRRLAGVLRGVQSVLESRELEVVDDAASATNDAAVARRIDESVKACTKTLEDLQAKIRRLESTDLRTTAWRVFLERVKGALRNPTITRINTELEARIQSLSTDLAVLQLFEQSKTNATITLNHEELLKAIENVGMQVIEGHKFLLSEKMKENQGQAMRDEHRTSAGPLTRAATDHSARADDDAIRSLSVCLQAAEDVHERFSSEYVPDNRSTRVRRDLASGSPDTPLGMTTPAAGTVSPADELADKFWEDPTVDDQYEDELSDDDVYPQPILDAHIEAYVKRAREERDAGHFNQAEFNLNLAIKNSQIREAHYGVEFIARGMMQEEMAELLQKQKKWAEAVNCVHQLLRETAAPGPGPVSGESLTLSQARQHHLLASIYYDRHLINTGTALSHTSADIEKAERHARIAFKKRWGVYGSGDRPEDEAKHQDACVQLLVCILERQDKTVESGEFNKLLLHDSSSSYTESIRRTSTNTAQPAECYEVIDKHELLVEAIRSKDTEQIQNLLAGRDLDLEWLSAEGKTFLMHAVEQSDESTVHRLLDPAMGAYANTANKSGLTALHFAVMRQRHDMIRCLLHHDVDIQPLDLSKQAPITKAVRAGDMTAVQIISDRDETTLQVRGGDEWSLLHYAVTSRKAGREMIHLLLDLAPDLKDAVDQAGKTALHHCVQNEQLEQVGALLDHQHHPDIDATDSVSRTPLYLAASKGPTPLREKIVLLLLRHGATVDERRPPPRMKHYAALRRNARRDSTLSRTSFEMMGNGFVSFALRRVAVRAISQQPSRQFSAIKSAPRISPFQTQKPSVYRSFHQSLRWAAEEDKKEASPAEAQDPSETVTVEPSAEEQAAEIKEESIATPEVADAAGSSATENNSATETVKEYASDAAETVQEYASDAAETVKDAAASVAQTFSSPPQERTERGERPQRSDRGDRGERTPSAPRQWEDRSEGNPPSKILYVGNLFFEVTAPKLEAAFGRFGEVVSSKVVTDARGLSKGFAFVEFSDQEAANRAKQELNHTEFEGRRLSVQYHLKKDRREGGFSPREGGTRNKPSKTLFIGNMSYQMSDRDLNDLFKEVRNVLDVRVAIDRRTGQPRGFAHADFIDMESAKKAKELLEQKSVYGRQLRIDYSRDSGDNKSNSSPFSG